MNIDSPLMSPSHPLPSMQTSHTRPKPKINLSLIKNIKGISTLMNNSSTYWQNTLENALCNCDRSPLQESSLSQDISYKKPQSLFKVITSSSIQPPQPQPLPSLASHPFQNAPFTKEWTKQENDTLLYNYFTLNNKDYQHLCQLIPTKSYNQIVSRIKKYESRNKTKQYSRQDDLKIIEYVDLYGKNWKKIALFFPGSTPEMLENRYKNKLDPKLKRTKFTKEEDEKVLALYNQFGNKWKEIASFFPDRNVTMIKNRFYSYLKKKVYLNNNSCNSNNSDANSNTVDNNSCSYGNSCKGEDTYSSVNDANSIVAVNNDFTNTIEEEDGTRVGNISFCFNGSNNNNNNSNENYNDTAFIRFDNSDNMNKINIGNDDLFFEDNNNKPFYSPRSVAHNNNNTNNITNNNNNNNNSLNHSLNKSSEHFFRQNSSTSNINFSYVNNNDFFMETYNKVFPMNNASSLFDDNYAQQFECEEERNIFNFYNNNNNNNNTTNVNVMSYQNSKDENDNKTKINDQTLTINSVLPGDELNKKVSTPSTNSESKTKNKKELEETHKLFKESINLEEILHKIDSMQNNFNNNNSNSNHHSYFSNVSNVYAYNVNKQYMNLLEKKEKAEKYQELLYDKLNKLKQDYVQSLKTKQSQTSILLEINNTLLKLISIAKMKIFLSKQINDFTMNNNNNTSGTQMQID